MTPEDDGLTEEQQEFLRKTMSTKKRQELSGQRKEEYRQNLIDVLDTLVTDEEKMPTRQDVAHLVPDEYETLTGLYDVDDDEHSVEAVVRRYRNQAKILLEEYDEFRISATNGMPIWMDMSDIHTDVSRMDDELDDLRREIALYVVEQGLDDDVGVVEEDAFQDEEEGILQLSEWVRDAYTDRLLGQGERPDVPFDKLQHLHYLRKAQDMEPVQRGRTSVDVTEHGAVLDFTARVSDFSDVSDDRFVFYTVSGEYDHEPRGGLFSFLSDTDDRPFEEQGDAYVMTDRMEDIMQDTVGWSAEIAHENLNNLDAMYDDLDRADAVAVDSVVLRKLGPFYHGDIRPMSMDEVSSHLMEERDEDVVERTMEEKGYESRDELREDFVRQMEEDHPRQSMSHYIGSYLHDNPGEFAFVLDRERYREPEDDEELPDIDEDEFSSTFETEEGGLAISVDFEDGEFTLEFDVTGQDYFEEDDPLPHRYDMTVAVPEGSSIDEYLPERLANGTTEVTAAIVYVEGADGFDPEVSPTVHEPDYDLIRARGEEE